MSKVRKAGKQKMDMIKNHIDSALAHLKDFEAMGYGKHEAFKKPIIELAQALMMIQEAIDDVKNWI